MIFVNCVVPSQRFFSFFSLDCCLTFSFFFALQAVNLVNGMIVDGLGHVSLDSGTPGNVQANNALSQANIHQGRLSYSNGIK